MADGKVIFACVGSVKYKKNEGNLRLSENGIIWKSLTESSSFECSYADIKVQRISPENSSKVQLQMVLHDDSNHNLHFANKNGKEAQLEERNTVKQHLAQLIPAHRKIANKELEQKNRLLKDNPDLYQLYKDLVVGDIITAEEFWQSQSAVGSFELTNGSQQQTVGISSGFLAEIKPDMHGCNELRFNLTADSIDAIFTTYPAVKTKYASLVPCEMTEKEFWTEFFHSQHFHRDRINSSKTKPKDFFADCALQDEKEQLKKDLEMHISPLIDMTNPSPISEEGYGASSGPGSNINTNISSSLSRRFNHQSTMVVKATSKRKGNNEDYHSNKKGTLRQAVELCELESQPEVTVKELSVIETDKFALTDFEKNGNNTSHYSASLNTTLSSMVSNWTPALNQVMSPADGLKAIESILPTNDINNDTSHHNLSFDKKKLIQQHYRSLAELLKHFWLCFPVTSSQLEEKLKRMAACLEKYRESKLIPLQRSISNSQSLSHLDEALDAALQKYNSWSSKRSGSK